MGYKQMPEAFVLGQINTLNKALAVQIQEPREKIAMSTSTPDVPVTNRTPEQLLVSIFFLAIRKCQRQSAIDWVLLQPLQTALKLSPTWYVWTCRVVPLPPKLKPIFILPKDYCNQVGACGEAHILPACNQLCVACADLGLCPVHCP